MAVNTVTQALGHTGIDLAGSIPASLFVKVQNWDAAALCYAIA
jgi:hypothetical protein